MQQLPPGVREEVKSWGSDGLNELAADSEKKKILNLKRLTLGLCGRCSIKTEAEMCLAIERAGIALGYNSALIWLKANSGKGHVYEKTLLGKERIYRITRGGERAYTVEYFKDYPHRSND